MSWEADRFDSRAAIAAKIARRVAANARGGVSGRHSPAMLAAGAALCMAEGFRDPRDRHVLAAADRLVAALSHGGDRRTVDPVDLPRDGEVVELWKRVSGNLRTALAARSFDLWVGPLEAVSLDGGTLVLAAPAGSTTWIERRYAGAIRDAAGVERVEIVELGGDGA